MESQGDPRNDPIVIWLNGGPGCSSLMGLLEELGPFRPNPDGRTLFENVFSWNKVWNLGIFCIFWGISGKFFAANLMFLETPRGVGFSYQNMTENADTEWDDTKTAEETADAIEDFFNIYKNLRSHKNELYLTGESYAGIYIPMTTNVLIDRIQHKGLQLNFAGVAIGNGAFSIIQEIRANADFMYFHGFYGRDEWDQLQRCCPQIEPSDDLLPSVICAYEKYVSVNGSGLVNPLNSSDTQFRKCSDLVVNLSEWSVWNNVYNVYALYEECYERSIKSQSQQQRKRIRERMVPTAREQQLFEKLKKSPRRLQSAYRHVMRSSEYVFSTDQLGGFPCYMDAASEKYLAQAHVRSALHIPDYVQNWVACSPLVEAGYTQLYNDSLPVLQKIVDSGYKFRILIYNGDADAGCNIFEAEYTFDELAKRNDMQRGQRSPWYYRMEKNYASELAGYQQRFVHNKGQLVIDVLTVKGAGHLVPTYRPGPALQMITNFLRNAANYSQFQPFNLTRHELLPQFQPPYVNSTTPEPEPETTTPEEESTTTTPEPEPTTSIPEPEPSTTTPEPESTSITPEVITSIITIEPESTTTTPEPEPTTPEPESTTTTESGSESTPEESPATGPESTGTPTATTTKSSARMSLKYNSVTMAVVQLLGAVAVWTMLGMGSA
ncbi:unnamed protein product [Anisakis simplex]|uniref:Carboxypeptidase n=1 Tax=Anisakis simplex TaxID=6269 RepID=A0A0M3IZM4_ANISI|nr:unnamed protein product [Anisakis simplex]